ncbi:DUF748 domain-containing protein [Magnetospira sp. QH-2]|uniref:DUF748 domain-containing protein n=1 Tax=Magnetospira sp. (strain QH-2) TaxID=1288970 RepID=UPI0003E813C4|nr:DUF748 domain-containing protein [Magnetospira sp. QH-2]CCQ75257.1 exported protein of unknown function [Magnetospira sp. QH-2]
MNAPSERPAFRRKLSIVGGIVLGLLLIVLALLAGAGPIAANLAEKELRTLGFSPKGLETLDLDWWEREVRFGPVALQRKEETPLRIERLTLRYDLAALWDRRLWVRSLEIGGIDLTLVRDESGGLRLNDVVLPMGEQAPLEPDAEPWLPGLDQLVLADSRIRFEDKAAGLKADLRLDRVSLDKFFGWQPDQPGRFEVAGQINDMDLNASGTANPFAKTLKIGTKGQLAGITLARLTPLVGNPDLGPQHGVGGLDWDLRIDLPASGEGAATGKLDLRGDKLKISQADLGTVSLAGVTLGFDGAAKTGSAQAIKGSMTLSVKEGQIAQGEALNANLGSLLLTVPDLEATLAADGSMRASGKPALTLQGLAMSQPRIATLAEAVLEDAGLALSRDSDGLLSVLSKPTVTWREAVLSGDTAVKTDQGRVSVAALQVDADGAGALTLRGESNLDIQGIEAKLPDNAVLAKITKVSLENILFSLGGNGGLAIQLARLGGEGLDLSLTDKVATMAAAPDAGDASAPEAEGMPLSLRIDRVDLDKASRLTFSDGSVEPPVKAQLELETFLLENLSNDRPDQPLTLDLRGKINQFAPLVVSGWAKPLGEQISFDLTGSIETLDLPSLSPYAARAVGMHLDGGRLGVSGSGKATDGQLDSKLDIALDKLAFTPLSEEDRKKLSDQVGMPVETVVGLLEDGNGHISIALPITGNLAEPDFDLSDAIGQAVGGAVQAAAGGIFKVLFPPAALIALIAESEDGGVDFKPVSFPPGQGTLTPEALAHGDQLALVLSERPKLVIRLCGRATGEDQAVVAAQAYADALLLKTEQALKDKKKAVDPELTPEERESLDKQIRASLEDLAVARARNMKQSIIDTHAIDAARLAECRSLFDAKDTQAPRVEITF